MTTFELEERINIFMDKEPVRNELDQRWERSRDNLFRLMKDNNWDVNYGKEK